MTDTRPLRARLAALAATQVGPKEVGGNNRGPAIRQYQAATFLPPDAWPWCAAFVAWCVREWLADAPTAGIVVPRGETVESWRCKDASAFGWEAWAAKHGRPVLPETALARIGDLVTYDFSHIGICSHDMHPGDTHIVTIEGNTQGAQGAVRDGIGDGVWRRERAVGLIHRILRLVD